MKKLYSIALAAAVAFTASATLPQGHVKIEPSANAKEATKLVRSLHTAESVPVEAKKFKAPAKAYENETWESLGQGTFKENLVLSTFGVKTALDLAPEFFKSTTTEGLYKVANPYQAIAEKYSGTFTFDASAAEPIYIHVVDGNKFYIDGFNTGLQESGNAISVVSQAKALVDGNGLSTILSVVPTCFGDFSDGVFDFGDPTLTLNGETYYDILIQIAGKNYIGNSNGLSKLVLPGVVVKDYTVAIDYDNCADANKFSFALTFGADVQNLKVQYFQGEFLASADNLQYVVEHGQPFDVANVNNGFTLDLSQSPEGIYTLLVASLDEVGALAEGEYAWVYVVKDNAEEWKTLEGKAKYTDDIVASIYKNHGDTEREVEIQENIATPGLYRLVNPYADPYAFASQSEHKGTHNHYININAVDPEKVYITEAPIGWELSDGAMVVSSLAYNELQKDGGDPTSYYGTLKDNVITFPVKSLLAREMKYEDGAWYYANVNNAFKVVLPEAAGINDVIAEGAQEAPVYYNLQGVRVANPENGLFIEVRGNKAAKVLK